MTRRAVFLAVLVCLCLPLAFGQTGGVVTGGMRSQTIGTSGGSFTTSTMQMNTPGVAGAPYSAEQVNGSVQTLADGTHITHTGPSVKMWRDSQGRTRTERQMGSQIMSATAPKMPPMIEIRDPVAGYSYILDTQGKVAHRITLQPMPVRGGRGAAAVAPNGAAVARQPVPAAAMAAPAIPNRPDFRTESLGTQMMEGGVMATGTRTTVTYPVGSMGNDRPIVTVSETWMSPDLKMMVLSKNSDPRSGENTTKLINLSRVEPDPQLFMPPADYSIVDESGPQVTIHYTAQ